MRFYNIEKCKNIMFHVVESVHYATKIACPNQKAAVTCTLKQKEANLAKQHEMGLLIISYFMSIKMHSE